MTYKIAFLPEAEKDFAGLDGSTKKDIAHKIDDFEIDDAQESVWIKTIVWRGSAYK
jgi:hypothetical protein